ncbi:MAG: SDR family NAD(P)-dependent oxidoreductase [Chloroflexaceae bacterium]|jgi:acyl transferase domain-containing protein/acyl carrier protein|nr:SDR family NAD(P)-dependent oxidoreductase [Chloroflexaceae bacterium]
MTDQVEQEEQPVGLDIAIVGMAGRFPGADNLDAFWRNLCDGVESISFFSDDELKAAGVPSTEFNAPNYVRAAPVLNNIDLFDADFFGYTPLEAKTMDPQQRFLLECMWEALEHAGYDPAQFDEPIGVFAGARMSSYVVGLYTDPVLAQPQNMLLVLLGNDISSLTTRISYKLNLRGPSTAVQSGCSTSLVAVHLACQSLLFGECRMALAGGVTINVPHTVGYLYEQGSMLSPDGHCHAFDAQAQGTVFGSGMGVVALKRLEDALADGDTIYAVIKGSATNNDGSFKASFTAPSVEGQSAVIIDALASSGIDAESISYIEAHATATALGDPIEVRALANAFRASTRKTGFCRIGTVKSNMGHLDAAAGMAGLLKTTLALMHQQIPPTLHFQQPNPEIDFANSPFVVNTELTPWERNGHPRRAGISSFGFGGTNAHVILEEAPPREPSGPSRPWQLLLLSARSPAALDNLTLNLTNHLAQNPQLPLADVSFTLKAGRHAFGRRRMLVCRSTEEAITALESADPQHVFTNERASGERPVVFMFPGQGAQYLDMGRELYETEASFRATVDHCAELLLPELGQDIRQIIMQEPKTKNQEPIESHDSNGSRFSVLGSLLDQTQYTQPALFVLEYALAQLWMAWGLKPAALIGHSIGEYVAACLAGVFTLEDGLKLVAARGRLVQSLPPGAMLSVSLPENELRAILNGHLDLAAVNAPTLAVVSGPAEGIAALESQLTAQEASFRRLHTSHAFHSAMMQPILARFTEIVRSVTLHPPTLPFISNVSGTWITAEQATDPAYWAQHLRQPVRFADGLRTLFAEGEKILLEVGPGRTLSTLARQSLNASTAPVILTSLRHPQDAHSDVAFILSTLGKLWLAGLDFDWRRFYADEQRQRVPLPTYPFERQSYWVQADSAAAGAARVLDKQDDLADWCYMPSWKQTHRPEAPPAGALAATTGNWLVFADGSSVSEQLIARLRQENQHVTWLLPGSQFAPAGENCYTVNPEQQADYAALLAALAEANHLPSQIVHLWTLTPDDQTEPGEALFERMQRLGFSSLIALAQALGAAEITTPLQLTVVSNQLHEVNGGERLSPEKATLLGPCRVIPREYLHVQCRSLDVVVPQLDAHTAEQLVELVLAEATSESADTVIAYRGSRRWAQTIERLRLAEPQGRNPRLRERGVYLITGGLGGVGLVFAKHLAHTVQARLVLLGRSAFPERTQWDNWLASHPENDATSRKIMQLRELEALGAAVLPIQADVTDAQQMQAVVSHVTERFGPLHGVIHAAGVAGGGVIQLKTPDVMERVLAPKTHGLRVLAAACEGQPLDFMLLCSSLTSVVGEFGQADYAAANAFLDAFAHWQRAERGIFTVAVNWDTWQQVGMAVSTEVPPELRAMHEQMLQSGILPAEGVQLFERVLAQRNAPQVLVSTKDLPARIVQLHTMTRAMVLEAQEQAEAMANRSGHARPALATAYVAPRNQFEEHVAAVWKQVLGVEDVGVYDSFFDLGGHSLLVTQLTNKLHRTYQVEISIRSLFDNPTVAGMASVIEEAYQQKANSSEKPIKELVKAASGAERQSLLEAFWKRKMVNLLNIAADQLPASGDLTGYDLQAIVGDVQWSFEQDFGLIVYPHETIKLRSIEQMARFTAKELDRLAHLKHNKVTAPVSHFHQYEQRSELEERVKRPLLARPARKNAPIFFSHSCVRSGSTLFRVMLAGHPMLYSPPELGILWYDTMGEWRRSLTDPNYGHGFGWAAQGLQWTFMELLNCNPEAARAYMDEMVEKDTPVYEVYERLQKLAAPRRLVDKSPSYTMSLETLQRAEVLFDQPKYIHLVRHPYAVIESVVRIRLDKLFSPVIYRDDEADPFVVGEKVWLTSNRNLLTFLQDVDSARQLRVYYEELVSDPERIMRGVCEFLELPYDPAVTQPYDNKRERMISGIGDPNILKHDKVDAKLGDTWRKVKLPWRLGEQAQQLAAELGYELPAEAEAVPPPPSTASMLEDMDEAQLAELLDSVKQLSPEEVQAMLTTMEQSA